MGDSHKTLRPTVTVDNKLNWAEHTSNDKKIFANKLNLITPGRSFYNYISKAYSHLSIMVLTYGKALGAPHRRAGRMQQYYYLCSVSPRIVLSTICHCHGKRSPLSRQISSCMCFCSEKSKQMAIFWCSRRKMQISKISVNSCGAFSAHTHTRVI